MNNIKTKAIKENKTCSKCGAPISKCLCGFEKNNKVIVSVSGKGKLTDEMTTIIATSKLPSTNVETIQLDNNKKYHINETKENKLDLTRIREAKKVSIYDVARDALNSARNNHLDVMQGTQCVIEEDVIEFLLDFVDGAEKRAEENEMYERFIYLASHAITDEEDAEFNELFRKIYGGIVNEQA